MRITARAKAETRDRILSVAGRLFRERGFAATSTRDLAREAGIAAGTLFNYFPSKEALGAAILAEGLARGEETFLAEQRGDESLEELLFAHIAAGLRALQDCRGFAGEVLEAALGLFQTSGPDTDELRLRHLAIVNELLLRDGEHPEPGVVTLHLYWSLYLGVLAFWARDDSPRQEDTLAVLDESMKLFVSSL